MAKAVRTKKIEETIPVQEEIAAPEILPEATHEPIPVTEPIKYAEERQPDIIQEESKVIIS